MNMTISQEIKEKWPQMRLGCIRCQVQVEESPQGLKDLLEELNSTLQSTIKTEEISAQPAIFSGREAYRAFGKKPTRYHTSAEALLRRVVQGKGLYWVNNVVEVNNLISLETLCPVGSYDLAQVKGDVTLALGEAGASYQGIGKDSINIENLPLLTDEEGHFGSPTSDSTRAMIGPDCREMVMCIYSFRPEDDLSAAMEHAQKLLESWCHGTNFSLWVVEA